MYQGRILDWDDMDIAIRRVESEINRLAEDCDRRRTDIERCRYVGQHIGITEPGILCGRKSVKVTGISIE